MKIFSNLIPASRGNYKLRGILRATALLLLAQTASAAPDIARMDADIRAFMATFRLRLPANGSPDTFELDWGEVRSYARRVAD